MIEGALKLLKEKFALNELDTGEFARIKNGPMTFLIRAFYAKGLGHVSTVSAAGMMGLMRMETVVIDPMELDLPLYSSDTIAAMGKYTLLLELYDTMLGEPPELGALSAVKAGISDIPEYGLGEHWYDRIKLPQSIAKRGKKKDAAALEDAVQRYLETYIALAENAKTCDPAQKRERAAEYTNGLLKNGGPSTDEFKKLIGEEKTRELFTKFVFGTAK